MTRPSYADMISTSDAPLVSCASVAPALDFVALFQEFGAYVPGVLRRLGVAEREIEDVAQDVFTVIHRRLPSFRGESSPKTWVCGITLRVARAHLRLARVRKLFLGEPPVPLREEAIQFDAVAHREHTALLERALNELSQAQRQVFVFYEIEELSMQEIAHVLGCAEKTAYTRLYAARRNVERHLRRSQVFGGRL